jgi:ribonuclease E
VALPEATGPKKRRRKAKGGIDRPQADAAAPTGTQGATDAPAAEAADTPAEEPLLPLLDLPEPAVVPSTPRPLPQEAELLLDSVLDALPAPKEPGQGRGRSRRASTTVIAGGELAPKGE